MPIYLQNVIKLSLKRPIFISFGPKKMNSNKYSVKAG